MAPHLLRLFGLGQKSEPTLFGSCRVWPVYVLKEEKKKHTLVCVSWGLSCLVWGRAACKDRRFWLIDWCVWTFPVVRWLVTTRHVVPELRTGPPNGRVERYQEALLFFPRDEKSTRYDSSQDRCNCISRPLWAGLRPIQSGPNFGNMGWYLAKPHMGRKGSVHAWPIKNILRL